MVGGVAVFPEAKRLNPAGSAGSVADTRSPLLGAPLVIQLRVKVVVSRSN